MGRFRGVHALVDLGLGCSVREADDELDQELYEVLFPVSASHKLLAAVDVVGRARHGYVRH